MRLQVSRALTYLSSFFISLVVLTLEMNMLKIKMRIGFRAWGWLLRQEDSIQDGDGFRDLFLRLCKFIFYTQYQSVSLLKSLSYRGSLFSHRDACLEIVVPSLAVSDLIPLLEEWKVSCTDSKWPICLFSVFTLEEAESQARLLWMKVLRKKPTKIGGSRMQFFLQQLLPLSG